MSQKKILNAAGANVSSAWQTMESSKAVIHVSGTFSGQAVTVQTVTPSGAIIDAENGAFTASVVKILELAKGAQWRMSVSNGGTPSIDAFVTYQR